MPDSCLGQAFCWVALLALPAWPAEFSGKVIGVTDGDTITVLHDRTPVKIRLHGIDCPENGQEYSASYFSASCRKRLVFAQRGS